MHITKPFEGGKCVTIGYLVSYAKHVDRAERFSAKCFVIPDKEIARMAYGVSLTANPTWQVIVNDMPDDRGDGTCVKYSGG